VAAKAHTLKSEQKTGKAAALLHILAPKAETFSLYDLARSCIWSTSGATDPEIDGFVTELVDDTILNLARSDQALRRPLQSGRTLLALPVFGNDRDLLAILVCTFSQEAAREEAFDPRLLKIILEPAIKLIGENVRVNYELAETCLYSNEVERELMLVYEVDEKIHGPSSGHSNLAQLVGQSGRYIGINYSVLLIPSKRIRISATHSSWKKVNRKALDGFLMEQLIPKLPSQREPVIFNVPPMPNSDSPAAQGFQALMSPILDKQGNVEGVLAQLGQIDKREFQLRDQRFMAQIARKAEYVITQSFDTMTGLMNRKGFEAQLHESYKSLYSDEDAHQIIYFDLDNLQLVNDSFSHAAGDAVVKRFAQLLEDDLPKSAVLSRITGDDFCMLLTHADAQAALDYANSIRDRRAELRYLDGDKSLQITMSVGIAEFSRSHGDGGDALTTARMACEAAKDYGGDRIEVFDDCNKSIVRRFDDMQMVAEIQRALDGEGFELCLQPLACLSGKPGGPHYEVLLRLSDGTDGHVPTKALFSAAERYQMMPHIDRWVVSTVLAKIADRGDALKSRGAVFAINLSGQSLADDEILQFIQQQIAESGVTPEYLCFEITESAAVTNLAKAQAFIDALRELGCSISLDDFGAGLSSFAYLKNFNVDTLKIDGGFVHDITENRISKSMVTAITEVAKVMELQTVAEFVGSKSAVDMLKKIGVDYAQGHYVGEPVAFEPVMDELANDVSAAAS